MKMEIIDKSPKNMESKVKFQAVGWKSLLQTRGGTSRILVLKSVVRGLGLERGRPIYSYIAEDEAGRPVMVSYLDGRHRIIHDSKSEQ